jgi:hypothetical protein
MAVSSANGGEPLKVRAKAAHVNMMTDTVIANLPPDALRSIVRGLLGFEQNLTSHFHDLAAKYILATEPSSTPQSVFTRSATGLVVTDAFFEMQRRVRCLTGCRFGFESFRTLTSMLSQLSSCFGKEETLNDQLGKFFSSIDGDIVQAVTAVQKELLTGSGSRAMTASEQEVIKSLRNILSSWSSSRQDPELRFAFARGFTRLAELEGGGSLQSQKRQISTQPSRTKTQISETVQLGSLNVPRMFAGLWQFSSPAWGTASSTQINADFRKHVDAGFTAYGARSFCSQCRIDDLPTNNSDLDMADHYGDAEVTFVSGLKQTKPQKINIVLGEIPICSARQP